MSLNQKQNQFIVKSRVPEGGPSPPEYQAPPQPHPPINKQLASTTILNRDSNKPFYPANTQGDVAKLIQGYVPKVPNLKPYIASLQSYPPAVSQSTAYPNGSQIPVRNFQRLSDEHLNKPPSQLNFHDNQQRSQIQALTQTHRPRSVEDEVMRYIPPIQRSRPSDEELLRQPPAEMLKFVKRLEGETGRITGEQSRQIQNILNDLKTLKDANQRLGDDNQELRDLCCFLDDDRQKGRKLAREWQRFGRYTASVMRQEVSAYQSKLRELDDKQQELIKDNLELKELCLYLDEERNGHNICPSCGVNNRTLRDDGDGSSSSTNADELQMNSQFSDHPQGTRCSVSRERMLNDNLTRQRSIFNDQAIQYVRNLEQKIKQLEEEKSSLLTKNSQQTPSSESNLPTDSSSLLSGRPEAVVRALQVLEVREQLERDYRVTETTGGGNVEDNSSADMDDGEKALVREMCNVVWRKLEENPPEGRR